MDSDQQPQDMDVESNTKPNESPSDRVRKIFNEWKSKNSYIHLTLDTIREQPENSLFFTLIAPGVDDPIFFQIYCNEEWNPVFIASENPLMEDHLATISAQMESRETPFNLHQVLDILGQTFRDTVMQYGVPQTPPPSIPPVNPIPQIPQNLPIPPFPNIFNMMGGMMPQLNPTHFPHLNQNRDPPTVATPEDWRSIIIPSVRMALTQQNFQTYEIEEWARRIQIHLNKGQPKKALRLIQDEILHGLIPPHIQKFFDQRPINLRHSADNREEEFFGNGTEEAQQLLRIDLESLKENNTKELGFEAGPIGQDLFYWKARLTGFGHDTKVGQQLYEIALNHIMQTNGALSPGSRVEGEVILEIKFPPNYPNKRPSFRIVKPRFKNIESDLIPTLFFQSQRAEKKQKVENDTNGNNMAEEEEDWNSEHSLMEVIQQIRTYIIDSGAEVEKDTALENYPLTTVGGFWKYFTAVTPKSVTRQDLESGGKLILPPSALEELTSHDLEQSGDYNLRASSGWSNSVSLRASNPSTPMIFEISADHGKSSHCGVEEFTAEDGCIVIPEWILKNLKAQEGDQINIRRVRLPKGTFVKLQPHTADFLEVNDTRAMFEWVLPKFMVLNAGDTIVVPYRDKTYTFNVLEVKPGNSVHIIDSDINVEFAPPLSGEVPPMATTVTTGGTNTSSTNSNETPTKVEKEEKPAPVGVSMGTMDTTGQTEGVDYKVCDNCKRPIPMANYSMHTLTCARNNYLCPGCNMVVQKSKKEEHTNEFHALVYCECGQPVEKRLLQQHKETDCPRRTSTCEFCPLQMPYVEKFEHERKCGSQTVKCDTCGRYVQKRDLPVHSVECSFSTGGMGSGPILPSRPVANPNQSELMACPICMSPFEHLDDLQVHMISEHEGSMDTLQEK